MIITYFTKKIFLSSTIILTTVGAVASSGGQEVSELSVEGLDLIWHEGYEPAGIRIHPKWSRKKVFG